MSQRPTVGRIVLYRPDKHLDRGWLSPGPPVAAEDLRLAGVISCVAPGSEGGELVTLTVFQAASDPVAIPRLLLEGDGVGMWSWPPRT